MRIEKILLGQAVRFIEYPPGEESSLPAARITRHIQDKYNFLQVPTTLEDYNFQTGISFLGGYFQGTKIDRFQIFERGVLCEMQASTDICDAFFDDLGPVFS